MSYHYYAWGYMYVLNKAVWSTHIAIRVANVFIDGSRLSNQMDLHHGVLYFIILVAKILW